MLNRQDSSMVIRMKRLAQNIHDTLSVLISPAFSPQTCPVHSQTFFHFCYLILFHLFCSPASPLLLGPGHNCTRVFSSPSLAKCSRKPEKVDEQLLRAQYYFYTRFLIHSILCWVMEKNRKKLCQLFLSNLYWLLLTPGGGKVRQAAKSKGKGQNSLNGQSFSHESHCEFRLASRC